MGERVLLHVPLGTSWGYGQDGIGVAQAFDDLGYDVHIAPATLSPPIPARVAMMLTRDPKPPFDLAVVHLSPPEITITPGLRATARTIIGWTMWEYEDVALMEGRSRLKREFAKLDALAVYDEVSARALSPFTGSTPLIQAQGGFDPEPWAKPAPPRDWTGTFKFGMVGALNERKDPFAAIDAHIELKEEHGDAYDAELWLKTVSRGLHPKLMEAYPSIKLFYEVWDNAQMRAFYQALHCLLAPSRGEGKNLPALEAMTTGIPVAATAYGGHMGWLDPSFSYPLDCTIEAFRTTKAAKVDPAHMKATMRDIYTHREEARRKGELAARTIPTSMSWLRATQRMLAALRSI